MSEGKKGYVARAMRSLSSRTHNFVCISHYVKGLLKEYGLPGQKCHVIYNGTNTQVKREFPSSLRDELDIAFDMPVIGTTGIWRPNKGFPFFIAAAERLNQWLPLTKYLLGGKAYGADNAFATNLWIRGRILRATGVLHYTGFQEDIGRFMSALDVFVLPSDCEPFGLVLIEAMARGIPVIATNAGGAPEIVVHGETGYLVPPRDANALSEAMYALITQPMLRAKMGELAQKRVRQLFDQKHMVAGYESLYWQVIQDTQ